MKKILSLISASLLTILTVGFVFAADTTNVSNQTGSGSTFFSGLSSNTFQESLDATKKNTAAATTPGGLTTTTLDPKVQNLAIFKGQDSNVMVTILIIVQNLFSILGLVAVLLLIAEGVALILARGDTDRRKKVVATIINIALGFALIILSWSLVTFILGFITGTPEDMQKQLNEVSAPIVPHSAADLFTPTCPAWAPVTQACPNSLTVTVAAPADFKNVYLKINNVLKPVNAPIFVTENEWLARDAAFVFQVSNDTEVKGSIKIAIVPNSLVSSSEMPANTPSQLLTNPKPIASNSTFQFEENFTTTQKDLITKGCKSPNTLYLSTNFSNVNLQSTVAYRIPLTIVLAGEEKTAC